jgi:integrase
MSEAWVARRDESAADDWQAFSTTGRHRATQGPARSSPRRRRRCATHTISLAEARLKARNLRQQLLDDIDPLTAKRQRRSEQRLEAAKAMSFGACVDAYLATHEISWRNAKHRAQWRMTLTEYCKPISDLPVKDIDTDLVLRVLTPLWKTRTETANRLRGRIERVLSWAKGRGLRDGENPARWSGHLDEMLAAPSKVRRPRHHPALLHRELPRFMADLRACNGVSARALELTILCATRTAETIGAGWDEIDLAQRVWTIPAERMKAGREHRIPLCNRALKILAALPRKGGRVFELSDMAMLELLRGMRRGTTVHGFRSTFRTWCSEQTNFAREVCEQALAHVIGDKVEAAYRRGDLYAKRARLMQAWASYCASTPRVDATVTPLHKVGADA